jgi:hypothetical protein
MAKAKASAWGKTLTKGMIDRIGNMVVQATRTGVVDTGSGKSSALDAAITVDQYEALKRQKEYIRNSGKTLTELSRQPVEEFMTIRVRQVARLRAMAKYAPQEMRDKYYDDFRDNLL